MVSQIGWIDLSPKDRDRVRRFMDIIGTGGIVDELGIGMIRDAMSNKLYPGFSTLYTRAKYFFTTPYILLDCDVKQEKNQSGLEYFQKAEIQTNNIVKRFYLSHPEKAKESYFGKNKQEGYLKRQPSEIYWNGMLQLHLIETDSSLDQLLTDKRQDIRELLAQDSDYQATTEQGEGRGTGCENVAFDANWQKQIAEHGLTLTRTEAETLRDRLQQYTPDSIPTALLTDKNLWNSYKNATDEAKHSNYIDNAFVHFAHNVVGSVSNNRLLDNLIAAHDMALFLHGAHIVYNIQLWSKAYNKAEGIPDEVKSFLEKRHTEGTEWIDSLRKRMLDYEHFDIKTCMNGTNVKWHTKNFLIEMQRLIRGNKEWKDVEIELCELVEKQERRNKGARSRFAKLEEGVSMNEMTGKPQWFGLQLINYRYQSARSIVSDIYQGLEQTEG